MGRTVRPMIDDDYFDWRPAVLCRPGAAPVDHRVPLVNGRPPGELDRPRGDGTYDRYRLVENGERAAYELVEPQAS
ncbi:MAG: hypothetical protein JWP32_2895 [Schumannella sp.]|nr:hypothetical protein [Schumannella sp.]